MSSSCYPPYFKTARDLHLQIAAALHLSSQPTSCNFKLLQLQSPQLQPSFPNHHHHQFSKSWQPIYSFTTTTKSAFKIQPSKPVLTSTSPSSTNLQIKNQSSQKAQAMASLPIPSQIHGLITISLFLLQIHHSFIINNHQISSPSSPLFLQSQFSNHQFNSNHHHQFHINQPVQSQPPPGSDS
jgi:hypothetical protein